MIRRGNTDSVEVLVNRRGAQVREKRPVRVFRGDLAQWRITRLGTRWFARDGEPTRELVLQLPAIFLTYRAGRDDPIVHRGWYPLTGLEAGLRARLEAAFPPGGVPVRDAARAAEMNAIKERVKQILDARRDPQVGLIVLAWESDQLICLDELRDWRFSELRTTIRGEGEDAEADVQTFLNLPLTAEEPENSQLLHSELICPAAYSTPPGRNCALHQISMLLGEDYHKLCDAFRALFDCLLYTSPSPRDATLSRMPSWA